MIARVHGVTGPLRGIVAAPSSKNYTTRMVLAAAFSEGRSRVARPAVQDDSVALVGCLRRMGATIEAGEASGRGIDFSVENAARIDHLVVDGFAGQPRLAESAPLNPGNAGAVLRMVLAVSALLPEVQWVTDYPASLGKRPNRDLLDALGQLGVEWSAGAEDGRLPITLRGGRERMRAALVERRRALGIPKDEPAPVSVSAAVSSQFASAMLFLAPLIGEPVRLSVSGGLEARSHIEATREVLQRAGVMIVSSADRRFHDIMPHVPRATNWAVNGDWPGSASILSAAAVVPHSEITIANLAQDEQGERSCTEWFQGAGCDVGAIPVRDPGPLSFKAPECLRGFTIDGDRCTDAVLALMGAAVCAEGTSRFLNIANLQYKECDRVREPIEELRKVFATALPSPQGELPESPDKALRWEPDESPDAIHVAGWPHGFRGGIEVDGRGDHRVIMMLSTVALRCREGLRIAGAEHVSKSFPGWFDTLRALGVPVDFE